MSLRPKNMSFTLDFSFITKKAMGKKCNMDKFLFLLFSQRNALGYGLVAVVSVQRAMDGIQT